jgi:hypothetical protein
MATTITITCPHCDQQLKAPADLLGKKMRCKSCGEAFKAEVDEEEEARPSRPKPATSKKAAPGKPPPGKKAPAKGKGGKAKDDDYDVDPYGVTFTDLSHRCPYCANAMESEDAVICLTCGYNTRTRTRSRTRKVQEQTGMDVFLWLLPGIACVIGILVILGLFIWYCAAFFPDPDPLKNEWYDFWKYHTCKIWVGVFAAFAVFYMGRFSIRRLITENTPPEIEKAAAANKE